MMLMSDRTVWTLSEQIGAYGDPVTLCVCGSPERARRRAAELSRLDADLGGIVWRDPYSDGSQVGEALIRSRSATMYYWLAPLPFYEKKEKEE
jgi:hypothetical protein